MAELDAAATAAGATALTAGTDGASTSTTTSESMLDNDEALEALFDQISAKDDADASNAGGVRSAN